MWPFGIIKLNIGSDTGLKCSIGSNISSVELFFFQWCEKRLCYRIVMWLTRAWKRLRYIVLMQEFLEPMRCILRAAITMKNKSGWGISFLISHLKRGRNELGTVLLWNLICNHFAWEKINDRADIEIVISDFKAANIADPALSVGKDLSHRYKVLRGIESSLERAATLSPCWQRATMDSFSSFEYFIVISSLIIRLGYHGKWDEETCKTLVLMRCAILVPM